MRNLPRGAAALCAVVFLGLSLSACGSDPGDTTCGEFKDMSVDERVDLLDDAADDEGDDGKAWTELDDAAKKTAAEQLPSLLCSGEDDDTKLDDIDGF